jgi:hypothetical protein
MKKLKTVMTCILISFFSTLVILVINLLNLLFSHSQVGYYTSYFGLLILEISDNNSEWDLYMQFGLNFERLYVFFFTILLVTLFYYILSMIFMKLKKEKGQVNARGNH